MSPTHHTREAKHLVPTKSTIQPRLWGSSCHQLQTLPVNPPFSSSGRSAVGRISSNHHLLGYTVLLGIFFLATTIATQQMTSNIRHRISSRPPSTSLKASELQNSAEVLSTLTSGLRISTPPISLPHNYNHAQKTAQSSASSLETPTHIKGRLCSASAFLILIRASA